MPERIAQFFNALNCVFEWKLVGFISGILFLVDLLIFTNPILYFVFTVTTAVLSKIAMWMVERYIPNSRLANFIDRCTGFKEKK